MSKYNKTFTSSNSLVTWDNWMAAMPDNIALSRLSIPGTHDSSTFKLEDPIKQVWVMTQDRDFEDQLSYGVRFFDFRGRATKNDEIVAHHSLVYLYVSLREFINIVRAFLQNHPTETVIMSLKEEYPKMSGVTKNFNEIFFDSYYQDPIFYKGESLNPTLGETRGKIVLLKRYVSDKGEAGYAPASWNDNATFRTESLNPEGPVFYIQDQYKAKENPKLAAIKDLMNFAKTDFSSSNIIINFTSVASGGTIFNSPYAYAKDINKNIAQFIEDTASDRVGWIIMDYAGDKWTPKLYQKVILANRKLAV